MSPHCFLRFSSILSSFLSIFSFFFFFFNDTPTTEIYTLSLHDALPISVNFLPAVKAPACLVNLHERAFDLRNAGRSEEHTSELQSLTNLVCRLLLEKKKKHKPNAASLKQPPQDVNYRHT